MIGGRQPLTVSQLTALVGDALARRPELEDVLVEGELSNLRSPGSGHLYFTLKDAGAALKCVCFRLQAARVPFHPTAGLRVVARGRIDVYAADGVYQLVVQSLDPAGVGAIALAVDQLRRRLEAEGLFDPARKRPLPLLPRRVAVVTSSTGAAVRDVCTVLRRRAPGIPVVVVASPVQGEGAEAALVRALERAQERSEVDVVLLVRGGGSIEDLVAFQGEALARAIAAARVPVVTGIGHETDTTIADWAADRRAATPSNAAEIAVPDAGAFRIELAGRAIRLQQALRGEVAAKRRGLVRAEERLASASPARRLPEQRQRLDGRVAALRGALVAEVARKRRGLDAATARLGLASPERRLPLERQRLGALRARLPVAWERLLADRRARVATAGQRLDGLSPLRVLERGYSITLDAAGAVLTSPAGLAPGDLLRTRLAGGEVASRVVEDAPGVDAG